MKRETVQWSVATLIIPALGGAFWAGHWAGHKDAQLEIAGAQLEVSELKRNREKSERTIFDQAKKIEQLESHLAGADNCLFVHRKIEEAKEEIKNFKMPMGSMFGPVDSDAAEEPPRPKELVNLEQLLIGYQQQLGTCGDR